MIEERHLLVVAFRIVVRAHVPVGSDLVGSGLGAAVTAGSGGGSVRAAFGGTSACPSGVGAGAAAGVKSTSEGGCSALLTSPVGSIVVSSARSRFIWLAFR